MTEQVTTMITLAELDAMADEDIEVEDALGYLLLHQVCFLNERNYIGVSKCHGESRTTVVFVNCNDVFAWGAADAEDLPYQQIIPLFRLWRQDEVYGVVQWVCQRRRIQPQPALIERMQAVGAWNEVMASLPSNPLNRNLKASGFESAR